MNTVLVIAGGTGGHIFPALAVAEELRARGVKVYWLGAAGGLEKTWVPEHFPMTCIDAKRLRGKGLRGYLFAPWRILRATVQAMAAIRKIQPQAVLAMGGFVSGPGGVAAKLLSVPLIIHEQNAVAGYSNRLLAMLANRILSAYPGVFPKKKNREVIGNPVRAEISALPPPEIRMTQRAQGPLRLLILGGSQGAHALNQLTVKFAAGFAKRDQLTIWHQTGKHDYPEIQAEYQKIPVSARAQPFIENMPEAYEWADLLICRAGALTVAEIAAVGVGAVLVPFPAAVDDHQWYNARFLEQAGAGMIIRERDLTPARLTEIIEKFLADRSLLIAMAQNARALAKPSAAKKAADVVLETFKINP